MGWSQVRNKHWDKHTNRQTSSSRVHGHVFPAVLVHRRGEVGLKTLARGQVWMREHPPRSERKLGLNVFSGTTHSSFAAWQKKTHALRRLLTRRGNKWERQWKREKEISTRPTFSRSAPTPRAKLAALLLFFFSLLPSPLSLPPTSPYTHTHTLVLSLLPASGQSRAATGFSRSQGDRRYGAAMATRHRLHERRASPSRRFPSSALRHSLPLSLLGWKPRHCDLSSFLSYFLFLLHPYPCVPLPAKLPRWSTSGSSLTRTEYQKLTSYSSIYAHN